MLIRKYKKLIIFSLVMSLFLSDFSVVSYASEEKISVYINGVKVNFDAEPIILNQRTLVPMRAIFESLGYEITWDENSKSVTALKNGKEIVLSLGNTTAYINTTPYTLDVPPFTINSRTMVPVRFIAEKSGAKVEWNESSKVVFITDNARNLIGTETTLEELNYEEFKNNPHDFNYLNIPLPETKYNPRGTKATISFDDSFPVSHRKYVEDLYNLVYPIILRFCGEPFQNRDMKIYYNPDDQKATLSHDMKSLYIDVLPRVKQGYDNRFDTLFVVELYHQFLAGTNIPVSRANEYYSWAVAKIVSEYLNYNNIRQMQVSPGRCSTGNYAGL